MPSEEKREVPFLPSTIETIDYALFDWLDKSLNIHTDTNKGWKKVPLIWSGAERAYHSKNDKDKRDDLGAIILPAITLERVSITKDLKDKGSVYGQVDPFSSFAGDTKRGALEISRVIQQKKTAEFNNADSFRKLKDPNSKKDLTSFPVKKNKTVYETVSIPLPVFIQVMYDLNIKAEYQQQMNEMMTPFITRTGAVNYFRIARDNHYYDAFIQQDFPFQNNISNFQQEERKYETKVKIKVLGHIIGEDKNQETPKIVVRENAVQVRFGRERSIFGDIPEHNDEGQSKYRS